MHRTPLLATKATASHESENTEKCARKELQRCHSGLIRMKFNVKSGGENADDEVEIKMHSACAFRENK